MKNTLICILSSEKTWRNFTKYNFHEKIRNSRNEFDFAIVLNGFDTEAINFYKQFHPDYFFLRENIGFDPAAIRHLLKLIPIYNYTLILHDDHWFETDLWLKKLNELTNQYPEVDIWGNILYQLPIPTRKKFIESLGLNILSQFNLIDFLYGMSGIFSRNAITKLKTFLIPENLPNIKSVAELGERIFSDIIFYLDLKLVQFPGGPFKLLKHGDGNERNYLFSTANRFYFQNEFEKAKEYYYKYFSYCLKIDYTKDFPLLFGNLAIVHFHLKEYKNARNLWSICKINYPDYPIPQIDEGLWK